MALSGSVGHRSHRRVARALFAVAVPLSALGLGALHTPVLCATAALVTTGACYAWFRGSPVRCRLPATVLFVTVVALTAFTALQSLMLPSAVVRILSPASAEVWSAALAPLHEPGPAWCSLSLDPTATRVQVLRGLTYLATFLLALRVADRHGGSRFLSTVIILSSVALALAAALHPAFGAHKVFGVYTPRDVILDRHIAPLLNANHLAAYLNIGFCLALAAALDRRVERLRPVALALALLLASAQLWVASRGGTVAMLLGAVCAVTMARGSRRFANLTRASLLLPAIVVGAGTAMVVLGLSSEAATDLSSLDASKLRIALSALPLSQRFPFFGVGRGAFEVAFPSTRSYGDFGDGSTLLFTHPEDVAVQWLTEWGIPVTVAGAIAILTVLRPSVALASSSPAVGPWSAIAATAVHNLVDFNSEVPAVGVCLAACAAMLVAGRGSPREGRIHRWSAHPRAVAVALGAAVLAFGARALVDWPHELTEERHALYDEVSAPTLDPDFEAHVRDALLRHPSEAYIPFVGGVGVARKGRSVLPWIERALTLSPVNGPAHYVLAQQLAPYEPAQARLEFRMAIAEAYWSPAIRERAVAQGTKLVSTYDDAMELVPQRGPIRVLALDQIAGTLAMRLPATRARLDQILRKLDPNARGPLDRIVSDATADLEAGDAAPWCEEPGACVQEARDAVTHLLALDPGQCTYLVARARLGIAAGNPAAALRELEQSSQTASEPTPCWRGLGELAIGTRDLTYEAYAMSAEEALSRAGCGSDDECAANLLWVASFEQQRGNARRALTFYQRAHDKAPERADILQRIADLASALGMHAQALDAYRTLSRTSADPRWQAAVNRERTEMMHEAVRP